MGGLVAWQGPALAQSDAARAAARDLGVEGVEDYQAGNYAAASQKLGRAFEILRVPTLGLWSARALAKEGKLVEASERYVVVSRLDAGSGDVQVQQQAKSEAAAERDALQSRIPSLTIDVKGGADGVVVTLDGAPLPSALLGVKQPANPGRRVIAARDGGKAVTKEVSLAEGQRLEVILDLTSATATATPEGEEPRSDDRSSEPAPSPGGADAATQAGQPMGFWVGVAVAGAGLATGGISAGLASQKKSDLGCPNDVCPPSARSDVDAHNTLLTVSTIGFVAAGIGAATAAVFLLTKPRASEHASRVVPWVGLGSAGVAGRF